VFENLALRQQLAVYHRTRPKPTVRWSDRLFWVGLRRPGGLESAGDRPTRRGHRPASPRLRVTGPTVASEGRSSAGRRDVRRRPQERPERTRWGAAYSRRVIDAGIRGL
jgi:hypothetical protein